MDEKDVDMEDAGRLSQDEAVGGQEHGENSQLTVKYIAVEQEKSPNLVNKDEQKPDEIGIKEEKQKLGENAELIHPAEEEMHPDQSEKELLVDDTLYSEKDAKAMSDENNHDNENDVAAADGDNTRDNEKDATSTATAVDDDNSHDNEEDAKAMDDGNNHNNENDVTAADDENTHDTQKDAKAATAVDDDNACNNEKGGKAATAVVGDDNGLQGEPDCDALVNMPEDGNEANDSGHEKHQELATLDNLLLTKAKDELEDTKMDEGYESGTPEDQAAFMKELETFCREKSLEFKPIKFYGHPLNYLKLWRSVIKLGGYDHVTGSKLWRQIGESFNPPKTCTTVSWTFRIFYEKALLEYERHKVLSGELELPLATVHAEVSTVENEANGSQTPGSGRARRDAAARAMQGWHTQRLSGYGEVSEPIIKDKNLNNSQKREKSLRNIGSLKQKRPNEVEHSVKAARTETSKQVVSKVADVGPPADWVKVNVREAKDSFEVFALVPGLLREEVRVQSDPAGRLVITGQPEQLDNPWGITPFKKVISLPWRIDPLHTSAIVSLHGQLYVNVPFERPNVTT